MSDRKLDYKISAEYSHELNDIRNKLGQLERGRVYELSGAKMDGYLATNIEELREMINQLLGKIQNGKDGIDAELAEAISTFHI
ncbi:hypothetical protein 10S8_8 [uncultured Caudovirales phage]|uniref:Uncharacterized protein n=1 Tax=uncultured Caudovirales phage TaxID=2100421 RepID=A0A2H4J8H2_9CAUD|nr:hypothetical protein 10S8_8 [uncultured Caudovirales phage]